jgi:type II restriction enzyme
MTISSIQRDSIRTILKSKLNHKIASFQIQEDMNKPFYFSLFSKEIVYTGSLVQSIYTWLGSKWEEFAEILAKDIFQRVERRYKLLGKITSIEQTTIDDVLKDLEQRSRHLSIDQIKEELVVASKKSGEMRNTVETVDLYLEDEKGEYYIELKSGKPNKNEMRAAKQDLLNILAIRQKHRNIGNIHTYLAIPFNPYYSGQYRRWTVTKFFNEGEDLLVGKPFWDFVGGHGAYEELLALFHQVGQEAMVLINEMISAIGKSSHQTTLV